ncbi:Uncharacterized protein BP5553_04951 [Venustampulla echinocandica]|uniref:Uncharacterized protein n=1 Tax=Venustampulla echinocandica TaxID=2656787 RepID=A0A370TPT0_9HELO|nr:Uncharacterized protein BP5553_04951 [Venustampulla echinocandica]RDL37518.1 Uncharacterized protein BP5553_04951 [Venustampulla echinocandica]
MTRVLVYTTLLVAFVAATGLTISAIFVPEWINYDTPSSTGGRVTKTMGLHRSCSSIDHTCHPALQYNDCKVEDRYFCSMWRSAGFIMSFAAVLEMATIVAYVMVLSGGKQKRETGWKLLTFLLVLVGLLQCTAMAIVAYLFDNDDRFFVGWKLAKSWIFCIVSWVIAIISAAALSLSVYVFPPEGGYELIPSERYHR